MTLTVGTQLGSFEITGKLGAGGMGEVYRATDTKLGREVAIKTLPVALAGDADRLARFEREAKLLASLNHAHIAAVHSLEETEGTLYIVMELVEGESLEQRLKSGPIPVEDALQYGLHIASALEAAHEKGVVHRDLKPANVMLTPDGVIKVLDFGLAKAFAGNPSEASPMHSPALSAAMTQAGLVLGTAGYMSPEQASGQATDQRADIWAFGVVMYEMLTGHPLFSGESVPHILADVLKTAPDWDRLPAALHPRIRLMLERCLEKKPRDRYAGIADVRVDIERVLRDPEGASARVGGDAAAAAAARRTNPVAIGVAALVGAVVVALLGWLNWPAAPAPGPVFRFSIPLPEGQRLTAANGQIIALSPDGTRIAYVADNQIYVRNAGEPDAVPVPGTAGDNFNVFTPTFSPDGQWLAFVQLTSPQGPFAIARIPVSGGAAVSVSTADGTGFPFGLSWPEADTLLFANREGIVRMPANGGATEVLVPSVDGERFFSPQLLPGGEAVLFTRAEPGVNLGLSPVEFGSAQIAVQSIGADDRTVVWEGGSAARYVETGHLIYAQASALFAIPFDPATRTVTGGPVPMLQNLRRGPQSVTDTAQFAVSATGTLAWIPGDGGTVTAPASPQVTLAWVDRDGVADSLPVRADNYSAARISPDGTKIALVVGRALSPVPPQIWIYDLTTENLSLLTADTTGDDGPVWSPDSRQIYFRSNRAPVGIYSIDVETGEVMLVAAGTEDFPTPMPWSISDDGQTLGVVNGTATYANLAALSLADNEFRDLIVDPESWESEPSLSPDGRWIVYVQNPPGNANEINVRPYPDAERTRIPVGDGISPMFSRDGSELFYAETNRGGGGRLMAAPVQYEPTLRVGTPQALFDLAGYRWSGLGRASDVDPSGERFLMLRRPSEPAGGGAGAAAATPAPQIDVVLNWFEEVKARVPVP